MKTVYVSGPITGRPDLNRQAFAEATKLLRDSGYRAVNPFEVCPCPTSWEEAMRADVKALMDCTHIVLLAGWEKSRGAVIEARLAADLGIKRIEAPV